MYTHQGPILNTRKNWISLWSITRIFAALAISAIAISAHADGTIDTAAEALPIVDLDPSESTELAIGVQNSNHVLSNPWFKNFELFGFAAVGLYQTGSAGTKPDLVSEVKETSLFAEVDVWDDTAFFVELQLNRLGKDDQRFVSTGEVYINFKNIPTKNPVKLGLKLGRFDIPFGEEYLWQDAIDNPLISSSAAYPYGTDEGILLYGRYNEFHWIFAITDGTDARSLEDNRSKAVNIKIYGHPSERLYFSFSAMRHGKTRKSAFEFGGSHLEPVGTSYRSSAGNSESSFVKGILLECTMKAFLSGSINGSYFNVNLGGAYQHDNQSTFDRDIYWLLVEFLFRIRGKKYLVLRYSEIGTYNDTEGFHFDGKTTAGANIAFGYDTKRFRRVGLGLGWAPHSRLKVKVEVGQDWFDLIDGSPLEAKNSHRSFFGVEVAVGF
jgi:hypothetical protein